MPLKVSQGMGAWIDDFKKSDAPQFKGKSDKERRDQAIAAYLDAKRKAKNESVDEKVDRDALAKAMAAYKAKGGKVTKAPAAKAQGYHGKDDPGKGMHGMLDKPDTKKIGTRRKVKSMEGIDVDEAVNYKFVAIDRVGKVIGFASDFRDAKDMAKRGHTMDSPSKGRGIVGRNKAKVVQLHKPLSPKKGDMMVGKEFDIRPGKGDKTVFSIGLNENYQVQKYTKGKKDGPAKSFGGNLKKATAHASKMGGDHRVHKEAKRTVTIDKPDRLTSMRVSKDKPPFDNAKPVNKDPKDKFGNPIKNRARHLARKAAKGIVDEAVNYKFVAIDRIGKVIGFASDERSAVNMAKRGHTMDSPSKGKGIVGRNKAKVVKLHKPIQSKKGDMMVGKEFDIRPGKGDKTVFSIGLNESSNNESSYDKLNKYNKDAQASKDKATNSAVATILRKGDHSKDLNTMRKRERGLKMVRSRVTDKIRKGHKANEGTVNELSPDTKKSYTKKATTDLYGRGLRKGMDIERGSSSLGRTKVVDKDNDRKIKNRHAGIYRAQK